MEENYKSDIRYYVQESGKDVKFGELTRTGKKQIYVNWKTKGTFLHSMSLQDFVRQACDIISQWGLSDDEVYDIALDVITEIFHRAKNNTKE